MENSGETHNLFQVTLKILEIMNYPWGYHLKICSQYGGMLGGRKLKAVIPGGSSCPVMPAEAILNCTMDYDSLKDAGSSFGTGAVIVMDETTCMVQVLRRIARFYMSHAVNAHHVGRVQAGFTVC